MMLVFVELCHRPAKRVKPEKIEETDPAVCIRILELRQQGLGMAAIGKRVGRNSRTVWRFLRGGEASSQVA